MKNMPRQTCRGEEGNYSGSKSRSPPHSDHSKRPAAPNRLQNLDVTPLKKRPRPDYEPSGDLKGPAKDQLSISINEADQPNIVQNEAPVQDNSSRVPLSLPPPPIAEPPIQSIPSDACVPKTAQTDVAIKHGVPTELVSVNSQGGSAIQQGGSVASRVASGVVLLIKELSEDNQTSMDGSDMTEDVLLRTQIAKLRVQGDEETKTLDFRGVFSLKKTRLLDALNNGVAELHEMASIGAPLWVSSDNGKKEILNYDEYTYRHPSRSSVGSVQLIVEASRETGIVLLPMSHLIEFFMKIEEWSVLFSGLVTRASDLGTLNVGDGSYNGLAKLIYMELHYPTPLVCSREFVLIRYCVKLSEEKYAILDVSVDQVDDTETSMFYCQKKPSGCIIENMGDSSQVTMLEHGKFKHTGISNICNSIIYGNQAFSAKRWLNAVQQQFMRLSNYVNTSPPIESSAGRLPPASKASMLKVAHRLTTSFLKSICGSERRKWLKMKKQGQEIHFMTRIGASKMGEPEGLIASAVLWTVLPIPHLKLYNYLRKKPKGSAAHPFVSIGKDPRYSMTIHSTTDHMQDSFAAANMCVLQECNSNDLESTVAFTEITGKSLEEIVQGENRLEILASGFSVVEKREEWQPPVLSKHIGRRTEEYSILTIGHQILLNHSASATLTTENLKTLAGRVVSSLCSIKDDMKCSD